MTRGRRAGQRGSVLLLVPAAVLVLMVLGSIAVDFAIAFMAQRELTSAAAAAANDAATAAMSDAVFYEGGGIGGDNPGSIDIDDAAAARFVARALEARRPRGIRDVTWEVTAPPGRQVCVTIRGTVDYIFAKAVPGAARSKEVTGRAVATAVEGPAGTQAAPAGAVCDAP